MVKAKTLTSAPGNSPGRPTQPGAGFTLIELLLVLVLIALASGLVSLALRDGDANALEREAVRLAALLEAGRGASRATGLPVVFALAVPGTLAGVGNAGGGDFGFNGLPPGSALPTRWLRPDTTASLGRAAALALGPEPLIGAQRIVLHLGQRELALVTDGLGPFVPEQPPEPSAAR